MAAKAKILVVEDERLVARDLQLGLAEMGYEVVGVAGSGREAIALARETNPDVVLMDIVLEGDLDGIEAAHQIRADSCIPVIYVTAHSEAPFLERAKESEPHAYLLKPFSWSEVHTAIEMALHKHRLELQLRESEQRFRLLFEHAPLPYQSLDVNGRLLAVNQAWLDALGYHREEVLGRDIGDFLASGDQELFAERFPVFKETGEVHGVEFHFVKKDGSTITVSVEGAVGRDANGAFQRTHCILQDVTERKKNQETLARSERLKALGELAAAVSHNFNNLLQVVMAGAQTALLDLDDGHLSEARANLAQVLESSRLAAETIRRLHEFARSSSVDERDGTKICDLSSIVRQGIEISKVWWEGVATRPGVRMHLDADLAEGCTCRGSDRALFEAVLNLIKNGVEALPDGGDIRVRTWVEDQQAVCRIEDSGTGIPREIVDHVFDPFFTTKGPGRAGMGLAGTYGIVKQHGGHISVESRPGHGTAFVMRLPLVEQESPEAAVPQAMTSDRGLSILVVDDLPAVVQVLKTGLTAYGQTVLTACSGEEGMAIFREHPVDAIVCDVGMPGMSGWDVGVQVKELCLRRMVPKTPLILLTGWGDQGGDSARIEEAGVDLVIEKPLDIKRLLSIVRQLIRETQG